MSLNSQILTVCGHISGKCCSFLTYFFLVKPSLAFSIVDRTDPAVGVVAGAPDHIVLVLQREGRIDLVQGIRNVKGKKIHLLN